MHELAGVGQARGGNYRYTVTNVTMESLVFIMSKALTTVYVVTIVFGTGLNTVVRG